MVSEKDIQEILEQIREKKPLVHHMTNWVTIYDCAQITRSTGALPVMAHAVEEAEEMTSIAGAFVLNIGTLTKDFMDAAMLSVKKANEIGIPVVLDAVGAGATSFRTETARRVLTEGKVAIIKGNAGEIATLAGIEAEVRGVESMGVEGSVEEAAKSLARSTGAVVVVTGKEDIITDGERMARVANGHEMMSSVVGTGCMATSVLGSFAAVADDRFQGAVAAMSAYGIAGEIAATNASGPMDFKAKLMDAMYSLSPEHLSRARVMTE